MKCSKCGYLGFKEVDRCPNCGYDFSLNPSANIPDLVIRPSALNTPRPLADLVLIDALQAPGAPADTTPELKSTGAVAAAGPTPELPLFGSPIVDDVPLITRASPPRTPLAVRRATPEVPRLRIDGRGPMLDLFPTDVDSRPSTVASQARRPMFSQERLPQPDLARESAGVISRVLAAVIDFTVLSGIDAVVVYFTMQICGVTLAELSILPKTPLLAFLIVQNISYFVAFTAGGQTLGKMAFGIKVVSEGVGGSPDLTHAVVRTLVWAALAVPAGLGLLTMLFTPDHRGLHDRFAGTRVIRLHA